MKNNFDNRLETLLFDFANFIHTEGKEGTGQMNTMFKIKAEIAYAIQFSPATIKKWLKQSNRSEKKQAPHWMDCNCACHGFGATGEAESCPHCQPERYPDYDTTPQGEAQEEDQ